MTGQPYAEGAASSASGAGAAAASGSAEPPSAGSGNAAGGIVGDVERRARAALTRIAEPGDPVMGRLLTALAPEEVLSALAAGRPLQGVDDRRAAGYRVRLTGLDPDRDLSAIHDLGGRFVCPGDADWPQQLDQLAEQRPLGLWVRGSPSLRLLAVRSVAMVGSRACTAYGAHVAGTLAGDLADMGWTVVSGAAYGVDGAAHRGALAVGGTTIAVLACGVDVAYPRGHTELLRRIAQQGLLVAELPPGAHPTRGRFVLRNRVIAALSPGTVVVEAEFRSGALITARRAAALGRYVMAVPGPVTSALSNGAHQLLREEAVLVTRAAEVVELCGSIGELAEPGSGPVLARDLLDPVAARVLDALPAGRAATTGEIARRAGVNTDETAAKLQELLPLGFVEKTGSAGWLLVPGAANACAADPLAGR